MSLDLSTTVIAVTGGRGFLGTYVCRQLASAGASEGNIRPLGTQDYDLRDKSQVAALYRDVEPHVVIHLAAVVGGIGANRENPGRYFYENLVMGAELIKRDVGTDGCTSSWGWGRSARIRSSRLCRSMKTSYGTDTRRRPTRPTAWQRR